MELPDNRTFCVAPWFQIRNENDGSKRVCCAIKSTYPKSVTQGPLEFLNSAPNIRLKKDLHQGTKSKSCEKCWIAEDNGRISLRQKLNGVLTKNASTINKTWIDSYFKHKNNFRSEDVLMADVKIGNTCNFACVMCVPEDSSMVYNEWRKKSDSFFIKETLQKDPEYLDKIKKYGYKNQNYKKYVKNILSNKKLRYLKLLGGEPLLDQHLLNELKSLPEIQKENLSLYIVTNGSKDLVAIKEYLGNFKSIMFTISLEGIGIVQDYARYGSNWDTVSTNILNLKKLFPSDVIIHTTLQTTTVLGLKDLANWCKKNGIALSVGMCQQPSYLSFASLPNEVREQVKTALVEAEITIRQKSVGDEEQWSVEKIIDTIELTKFDPSEYKKFIEYVEWYEKDKKINKLSNIFPSLFIDKHK